MSYRNAILSLNPIFFIPCDVATGSLVDIVTGSTLSLTGTATYLANGPVSKEQSYAVLPGTVSSRWRVDKAVLGNSPYTHCLWMKDNNVPSGTTYMLGIVTASQNYFGLRYYTSGARRRGFMSTRLNGVQRTLAAGPVGANDAAVGWTLLTATWDGEYQRIYVNDELLGTSTSYAGQSVADHTFIEVNYGTLGLGTNSELTNVAMFSYALSLDQIKFLYLVANNGDRINRFDQLRVSL